MDSKKKRNISSGKDQRNYNTEKNENVNKDNLNINEELEKNQKNNEEKPKKKNKFGGLFSFGKNKEKKDKNKEYKKQNSSNEGYSFNSNNLTPQMNYGPINNGNYNNYNKINSSPVGYNPMNPQTQIYNSNQTNSIYSSYNYNMTPTGSNMGQSQGGDPYVSQNGLYDQQFNPSIQQTQNPQTQTPFISFGQKQAISKNVYSKIKPEDLRVVSLYLKNGNIKYQE